MMETVTKEMVIVTKMMDNDNDDDDDVMTL